MTPDQWIAAVVAVLTGVAIRVIDHYWPELGDHKDDRPLGRHKDTSPGSTPSSESGEV